LLQTSASPRPSTLGLATRAAEHFGRVKSHQAKVVDEHVEFPFLGHGRTMGNRVITCTQRGHALGAGQFEGELLELFKAKANTRS
jgi:hypothetical protein